MYKVGMYGGSFNPLHLGHVNDIIKAANKNILSNLLVFFIIGNFITLCFF